MFRYQDGQSVLFFVSPSMRDPMLGAFPIM